LSTCQHLCRISIGSEDLWWLAIGPRYGPQQPIWQILEWLYFQYTRMSWDSLKGS
jgi:hypothetical protein